ncbi:DUF1524 domain-containing protein [Nocardioides sp. KC13]|uniref:DUF1524 domain-containing protein n=1 Tax=Nocardioides turkmenicus TaxID=2711220 RepID=A0A6M1QW16_9ACTN|nr:DUF1524 domain-containing protein [Nocardioides sp. KC13]NGN94145.1 DUF1524 domain-containing protein [Nocardioides sp. KC13]
MLRPVATLLAVVLLCTGCAEISDTAEADTAVQAGYGAETGGEVSLPLTEAVARLPVAKEVTSGYEREKFNHWVDADGDCQDARNEVLLEESRKKARGRCEVSRGAWFSAYDGLTLKRPGGLDIDHMVALKEGWESGANAWSDEEREAYANDLGDPRALIAVTAATNRSKGDQDPADWLPDATGYHCTYVADWVAVKIRWGLFVDRAEKAALTRVAAGCDNPVITVRLARAGQPESDPSGDPGGGSGEDPRFDTCAKATAKGYGPYRKGSDTEYEWYRDGDKDGTVCDS